MGGWLGDFLRPLTWTVVVVRLIWRYRYVTIPALFVLAIWRYGVSWLISVLLVVVPLLAGAAFVWYLMKARRFAKELQEVYADRNRRLEALDVEHWDDWYRCVEEIAELESAGMSKEDARRDVLGGDKHPRPVALSALEFALKPGPTRLPKLLSFREKALEEQIEKTASEELDAIRAHKRQAIGDAADESP